MVGMMVWLMLVQQRLSATYRHIMWSVDFWFKKCEMMMWHSLPLWHYHFIHYAAISTNQPFILESKGNIYNHNSLSWPPMTGICGNVILYELACLTHRLSALSADITIICASVTRVVSHSSCVVSNVCKTMIPMDHF